MGAAIRGTLAGAAWLLAGAAGAQTGAALSPEQLFERVAPSVWTVETVDTQGKALGLGSAVVIAPGTLVTNCHVLAKAKSVLVARENVSYGATRDHADPERDLCLLKVRNFNAPAVTVGDPEELKIGARVYAIGSPRGLEQTISDGLLSGVRKNASGSFTALQVTVPISPGSSGGGLFDTRGRLIGITTFMLKESQNLNFAMPANWIAEVPERAQAKLAARSEMRGTTAAAGGRVQVFEYELRDRLTNTMRKVAYRLERMDGEKMVFNQGTRVEKADGSVVSLTAAIGGDFELAMPPGGWIRSEPQAGASWTERYRSELVPGAYVAMELKARVLDESTLRLKDRELRTLQVEFTGYTERNSGGSVTPRGRYRAVAWYAPELNRIVRFEVKTRGGQGSAAFMLDEQLELVEIRSE